MELKKKYQFISGQYYTDPRAKSHQEKLEVFPP